MGFFGLQSRQREIMNTISYLIDKLQSVANLPIQYAPSISSENVLEDEDEERTKTLYTWSASDGLIYTAQRGQKQRKDKQFTEDRSPRKECQKELK
jgi:hypothetical protein